VPTNSNDWGPQGGVTKKGEFIKRTTIKRISQYLSARGLQAFNREMEASYQDYRHEKLRHVMPLTAALTAAVLLFFALSDYLALPDAIALEPALLRLLINIPMVLACAIAAKFRIKQNLLELLFAFVYLSIGLVTVHTIYLTEFIGFPRPREGFLLVLILGYFLLQMQLRVILCLCGLLSFFYLTVLTTLELSSLDFGYAVFFVFSFNFAGLVSAYMQDRSRRELFLNEQDLIKRKEKDHIDIEQRKQLMATASHDLRQPLQGLNLLVDSWIRSHEGTDQTFAYKMQAGLAHINRLLNSLFSLSHIEHGTLGITRETINLSYFLNDLLNEEHARIRAHSMQLHLNCPDSLTSYTDPTLLGRVIRNIIHNAIDHSGASELKIHAYEANPHVLCLEIADNGCGADPTKLPKLKTKFNKGNSRTKTGLGVGLFIIEELAEKLSLSLQVTTKVGAGFHYQLNLPRLPSFSPATEPITQVFIPDKTLRGHLLVVENDALILSGLQAQLTQWGFTCEAYAGVEAVYSHRALPKFDMVISDYHLDEANGVDLINYVRERTSLDIPAFILSADTTLTTEKIAKSITCGPSITVHHKPITSEAFFNLIKTRLG
jgi:signal transduction histidine kinase/CheY-like chemotaxis protein